MHAFRKYILCGILTGCALNVMGQTQKVKNLPYTDFRRIHYGFFLGAHTQDLAFTHTGITTEAGESWYAEQKNFSIGFTVGLTADLALMNNLNLRFTPSMYMGNRHITFRDETSGTTISQDIKANQVALPISLKYSAHRVNNYRPYVVAGINPSIDLSKQKETPIILNRFDFALEFGLGCDIYLPYFKFIPELRFSFGLLDLIKHKRSDLKDPTLIKYTDALDKATSRTVSILFYFE